MSLKLMYITNRPDIAQIAESSGVDRIFVDMEYIGKSDRQGGLDSVQNHHTVADVRAMKQAVESAEVLVRVNPIHEASDSYSSSQQEIDDVIRAGADIVMLPFITDVSQVRDFLRYVGGRAKTMPLIETPQSVEAIDEILALDGIDEIYIAIVCAHPLNRILVEIAQITTAIIIDEEGNHMCLALTFGHFGCFG